MKSPGHADAPNWVRPFQRVTSRGDFVAEIDGMRTIALLMVILLHLNHYVVLDASVPLHPPPSSTALNRLLDQGDFGVQLFFAISGFILALPFAKHAAGKSPRVSLKSYFLRRLTRLEPPLLVNLVILMGLMVFVLKRPAPELWPHFIATCTYLHSAIFGEESRINPVTWSLEVEAQFYLCMPLLAQLYRIPSFRVRQRLFIGAIVVLGANTWLTPKASLLAQLEYFLIGLFMADLWVSRWRGRPALNPSLNAPACTAWLTVFAALYWNRQLPLAGAVLPILLLLAMLLSFRSPWVSGLLSHWLPTTLGGMCYTLYLYHLAVISSAMRITQSWVKVEFYPLNYLIHALLILPCVVLAGILLFVAFEKPFMSWRLRRPN